LSKLLLIDGMEKQLEDYILIIDDSETNNVLLEALLEDVGYATKTALSASEGWMLVHKQKPRLILLDLLMPKISGFQMLDRLKATKSFADIPVVIVSALNDPDTIDTLMKAGADDFFAKPINIKTIIYRVQDLYPFEPSTK
jgi:two-component system cell cycle response regulator DivK